MAPEAVEDAAGMIRAAVVRKLGKYFAYFSGFLLYVYGLGFRV